MSEGSSVDAAPAPPHISPSTPAEALDDAIAETLAMALRNAASAQQQAWVGRQAAVTMACAGMMSLCFGTTASTPPEASAAGGGTDTHGAQALADAARRGLAELGESGRAAGAEDSSARKVVGFAKALACLDAADMLRGAATLSTLVQALALAKYVATGDDRYATAAEAGEHMLARATAEFERFSREDAES
jgi:hypothetical protein